MGNTPPSDHVYPAPEVPCRQAWPDEIPSAAAKRGIVASNAGWVTYRATYAKGPWLGTFRTPESIVLGWKRGTQRVVAMWLDGSYELSYMLDESARKAHRLASSDELTNLLKGSTQ